MQNHVKEVSDFMESSVVDSSTFKRGSIFCIPLKSSNNRFFLSKKYKGIDNLKEVIYSMDSETNEPVVSSKNLWVSTCKKVQRKRQSGNSTTSSSSSISCYITASSRDSVVGPRDSRSSTPEGTHFTGCRRSCYSNNSTDNMIDLRNISLIKDLKEKKPCKKIGILKRSLSLIASMEKKNTYSIFSLRRNKGDRLSRIDKSEVTPIESALNELKSSKKQDIGW